MKKPSLKSVKETYKAAIKKVKDFQESNKGRLGYEDCLKWKEEEQAKANLRKD